MSGGRAVLAIGAASVASASIAACSLLVDTDDLSTGRADASASEAGGPTEAGTSDASEAGSDADADAAVSDPCAAAGVVFCSRFDGPASLDELTVTTDPETRVEHDTTVFFSPPGSARFTIDPSTNNSADATLKRFAGNSVAHAVFSGVLRFDRSEAVNARLVAIAVGDESSFLIDRNGGNIVLRENGVGTLGTVPVPSDGTWFRVELDLDGAATPPQITLKVGTAAPVTGRASAGSWAPGRVFVEFGVSETNTPASKGWLVHWDDVSIRKL